MSYILEALKKSEQERGHGDSPNVQTVHTSSLQYQQKHPSPWPAILTVIVTLNLVALGYFVYDRQIVTPTANQQTITPSADITRQVDTGTHAVVATPPQRIEQPPDETLKTDTQRQTPDSKPRIDTISEKSPVKHEFNITSLYDLPTDVQASIPELTFSAHVYSSNPAQRSVVINGNFMEEGDMLTSSLRLNEITNDGVVFDYDGMRFHSSVVSGWNIN